ncbi:MAG: response regulator [Candidatus Omnitrophica bacterium]|nr:response regulator [Candidatus Omnitrophota bacterium]
MNPDKKRILIVDDEEQVLKILRTSLTTYEVETSLTGKEALSKIKMAKPDLILLDILLGKEDGIDVLKQIKELDKSIPVVMVTALHDNEEGKRAFAAGAADYITKPIDFDYLKKVLLFQLL